MMALLRKLFGRKTITSVAAVPSPTPVPARSKTKTCLVAGAAAAAMAVALVGGWEGLRTEVYLDIRGFQACRDLAAAAAVDLSKKPELVANARRASIRCDAVNEGDRT